MAQWQAYQAQAAKNSPTLMAGQTIAVNKYTVQVERYLSQGGFAHVYLVRTATPVYNTTHHVLKRIAVPDEAMLTEVKKEVDIMRILKGHPNIVHLIDAASHRMADGAYEVFILMEFCSGGGIIDMMNRRLRERLTEAEILTIFVDVCEGLAAMHALKPPLLHRDLKVENILQSSPTLYKLCDFGSANPVHKVPANGDEFRALQADLDRHTTMQYRAPEMVNLMQRRPIDEKSDVWALGVLLYKLCYYTTPFEERGPLAIQNVHYSIPPYPVYSQNMVSLIGTMLREYGTQRPTVFELLNHVHTLRGTKSRYAYSIAPKQPSVPPRTAVGSPLQSISSNIAGPGSSHANPMDDLVLFKSRAPQPSTSPSKNAGVQARDKVLEAIAPMRRGRPQPPSTVDPSSSVGSSQDRGPLAVDAKFDSADDRAWRAVHGQKSGMASIGGGKTVNLDTGGDPWGIDPRSGHRTDHKPKVHEKNGFDNDFSASPALGFGDSFEPPRKPMSQTASPKAQPIPITRPTPSPTPSDFLNKNRMPQRDAFEGLGLTTLPPPQTLGDARRARTGLAASNLTAGTSQPISSLAPPGIGSSTTTYRPPSAHVPSSAPHPPSHSRSQSPSLQSSSWQHPSKVPRRPVDLSAEERFPSLEELDRTFTPSSQRRGDPTLHAPTQPPSTERLVEKLSANASRSHLNAPGGGSGVSRTGNVAGSQAYGFGEPQLTRHNSVAAGRFDGTRSQNVTGTAMRESRQGHARHSSTAAPQPPPLKPQTETKPTALLSKHSRPVQPRRHRSSLTMKTGVPIGETARREVPSSSSPATPALPPRPNSKVEQRDWLTGISDDEAAEPASLPVLRDSPSKRASFIERSPIPLERPLEAVSVQPPSQEGFMTALDRKREEQKEVASQERQAPARTRSIRREHERIAPPEQREKSKATALTRSERTKSKERRDGRRSPTKSTTSVSRGGTGSQASNPVASGVKLPGMEPKVKALATTSASSGLTDNWSPIPSPTRELTKDGSSSSDEGPEDLGGYKPGGEPDAPASQVDNLGNAAPAGERKVPRGARARSKGRQNSVHDLVDLWDGSQPPKSPTKVVDKRRSAIVTSPSMKQPLPGFTDRVRSSPSQPAADASPPSTTRPTTPSRITRPPSRQQTKLPASTAESGSRTIPVSSPVAVSTPSNSSSRTRPQSMFLNPVAKTAVLETSLSSTNPSAKQSGQASDDKQRRSGRRTSISDMVQRYESINGATNSGNKPPPPIATKPTMLSKTMSEASSTGLPSPSSAATRFPRLSPESSPVQAKHLAAPDMADSYEESSKHRRSPSPAARSYMPPSRPMATMTGTGSHVASKTVSEFKQQPEPRAHESTSAPQPRRQDTLNVPPEDNLRSPSPEKPFQGVSRLIDRWQRVVDQNEMGDNVKRGSNSSLRGR